MSEQLRDEVLRAVDKGFRVCFYSEDDHPFDNYEAVVIAVGKWVGDEPHAVYRSVRHVKPRLGPGGTIDPLAYSLRILTNELEREIGE